MGQWPAQRDVHADKPTKPKLVCGHQEKCAGMVLSGLKSYTEVSASTPILQPWQQFVEDTIA